MARKNHKPLPTRPSGRGGSIRISVGSDTTIYHDPSHYRKMRKTNPKQADAAVEAFLVALK